MQDLVSQERSDEINEHLTLIQDRNGLTFGTDAFLLSAFCRPIPNGVAADLGCGTGVVALLLAARKKYRKIYAVELQERFAALTARNVEENRLSDIVTPLCIDVRGLTARDLAGELDVIAANPPYLKTDCGFASPHPQKQIARHEEFGGIAEFAAAAGRCLKSGGLFVTVYRPDRLDSLFAALREAKLAPKRMVFVQETGTSAPSMVLTEAKKDAAEGLDVLPSLILRDRTGGPLCAAAQRIYDSGSFQGYPFVN